jgi:3-mercaptopyruvate sulfurtransferase SseA
VALKLKRAGITRVRPLHGGLSLWMDQAFPTTEMKPNLPAQSRAN